MNQFAGQKLRHRSVSENKRMDTNGGKRRGVGDGGVMNFAIEIDMYTLMCVKLINKNLLYKKN